MNSFFVSFLFFVGSKRALPREADRRKFLSVVGLVIDAGWMDANCQHCTENKGGLIILSVKTAITTNDNYYLYTLVYFQST